MSTSRPLPRQSRIRILPAHILSARNPLDYLRVLAWTFWSPLTLYEYCRRLVRWKVGETPFPPVWGWEPMRTWWRSNPYQRGLLVICVVVAGSILFGIWCVNWLYMAPLLATGADGVLARRNLFFWLLGLNAALWLLVASEVAVNKRNLGVLLVAALPVTVLAAALLLLLLWGPYTAEYLQADPILGAAIFLVWGYCIGYYTNILLAMLSIEINRLRTFIVWYGAAVLGIYIALLMVSGITWATLPNITQGVYQGAFWGALCAAIGLLSGLLRPAEYLYVQWRLKPADEGKAQRRAWAAPGSTLLPADGLQDALHNWMAGDWNEGVRIAARLSHISRQQRPLVQPMQAHLAPCETDELLELAFNVYDSGARCARNLIQPVPAPRATGRRWPAPKTRAVRDKKQDRHRYEQEVALSRSCQHPVKAPVFKQENDTQAIEAMLWYYDQCYPYHAAEAWQRAGGSTGSAAKASPRLVEFGALVETFQALVDLPTISATSSVHLPARPDSVRRQRTWAIVDHFIAAAHWAWRARRWQGQARTYSTGQFQQELLEIQRLAQSRPLAERRLVGGLVDHWRSQFDKLLRTTTPLVGFDPIRLRDWNSVRPQLGHECPWRRAALQLHDCWQLGHTVVTYLDGQPESGALEALQLAVHGSPRQAVLALFDLVNWPANSPITPEGLLARLCMEIAARLGLTGGLPTAAVLSGLTPDALGAEIERLCRQAPDTCVVLCVGNAHLLLRTPSSGPQIRQLIVHLGSLEQRIDNLALTLAGDQVEDTAERLARLFNSAARLNVRVVRLPLLTLTGVRLWLAAQFDPFAVHCDEDAVQWVHRLTGGHVRLLEWLGQALASDYNGHSPAMPACPILNRADVERGAQSTIYANPAARFFTRLLQKHGADDPRQLLLDLLADNNATAGQGVTVKDLVQRSAAPAVLRQDYVQSVLDTWYKAEVVEMIDGATPPQYQLRSLSFARWL